MSDEPKIKLCPFCGNEPQVLYHFRFDDDRIWVGCKDRGHDVIVLPIDQWQSRPLVDALQVECCAWTLYDTGLSRYYETSCQMKWILYDDVPDGKYFNFCPYCGRKILVRCEER
jgi:hypothetical protein